jgi:hypothetical protein
MTDRNYTSDVEANEMMDEVLADAEFLSTSPVLTPFVTLGTDDPGAGLIDSANPPTAGAHDLWQAFSP